MYYLFDNNWREVSRDIHHDPLVSEANKFWDGVNVKNPSFNWIHEVYSVNTQRRVGVIAYLPDEV
jgi:hypothetical protein